MRNCLTKFILMLVLMSVWICLSPVSASATLFGITFDNELISIDESTGAGSLIGTLGSVMGFGLADLGGSLYTYDQSAGRIAELDPTTGGTLQVIDIGLTISGEAGLTFRSDGAGFIMDNPEGDLYTFDIIAGTSSLIVSGLTQMDGLDFDGSDVLFGLSQVSYELYTSDEVAGLQTFIGDTGQNDANPPSLGGLSFRSDGALFGALDDDLYTIDPTTGGATFIGDIGFDKVSGLSFLGVVPVPEPSTTLLLGTALIGLAVFGRRFKK